MPCITLIIAIVQNHRRDRAFVDNGVYVESGLSATRKNILAPGSVGVYSGGSNYNPAQVIRDESVKALTEKIDKKLEGVGDKGVIELPIKDIQELISWNSRVGDLKGRVRRIMIIALARKLVIALWRYVETGKVPNGAIVAA